MSQTDPAKVTHCALALPTTEHFSAVLLDRQGDAISRIRIEGDNCSVHVDLVMLGEAILAGRCRSLLLSHNHPSGDPQPSLHDIRLTRTVATLARTLGARLIDHRIYAGDAMFSFRAEGLI